MDSWINKFSNGRFTEVLQKGANRVIVIAAALNFKAKWHLPLEPLRTPCGTFEISPTEKIEVPMYKVAAKVIYYKDADCGFHLVGIPFKVNESCSHISAFNFFKI